MEKGNYAEYDFKKIRKIAIAHAKLLWKSKQGVGMFEIRKHLSWYFRGFPDASQLRQKLVRAESIKEIQDILK